MVHQQQRRFRALAQALQRSRSPSTGPKAPTVRAVAPMNDPVADLKRLLARSGGRSRRLVASAQFRTDGRRRELSSNYVPGDWRAGGGHIPFCSLFQVNLG